LGTLSAFDESTQRLGVGTAAPTNVIEATSVSTNLMQLSTVGGTTGPRIALYHPGGTTSDIGAINFLMNDNSATQRQTAYILGWYLDGTTSSQDSEIHFCVQNNVNAGNCNTIARLNSLGVWTDASSAAHKDYEGDIIALDKLKELKTIGVYRAKGLPEDKIEKTERHYSPTAEDFHRIFGFGNNTTIAPKDAAWIAAKAVLELEARVAALEKIAP
jgi:hypothetical protein